MNRVAYVSYLQIVDQLDIQAGDKLFISSDVSKIAYTCRVHGEVFDGNLFIDSIIRRLGSKGTLIFPTFNWGFCRGIAFDYHQTKSETGVLSQIALKRSDFKRTRHPIYSFAVWGHDQEWMVNMENTDSFGPDSPFALLASRRFKNLFIDVDYDSSATFVIHCEQMAGVPYRYSKQFTAEYRDEFGVTTERTYSMYVRDLDQQVISKCNDMHSLYVTQGCAQEFHINDSSYVMLALHEAYDLVEQDIVHNRGRKIVMTNGQVGF